MKRLLPRSLIGQIALVMALVLLVLQAINFSVIRTERQRLTQSQLEGPVVTRFVATALRLVERERERPILNRRGRVGFGAQSHVAPEQNDAELAARLRETAAANGLEVRDARAGLSDTLPPPPPPRDDARDAGPRESLSQEDRADRFRSLLLSIQLPDGRWVNGQLLILRPNPWPLLRLAGGTLLLYAVLLLAMILVLARLIRPLRDLTRAAQRFRGHGESLQLQPRGPADIRRAIEAFNAMGSRVSGLIDEKDRMLGAIGHDLRTPLASLRIRVENMEPPEERDRMIATIEEMTALLDDTLALARSGRSSEPQRALDVAALADAVVEEFRELGHDVTMEDSARSVACVRANLVRGAIRNLVDNAIKYAGAVELAVSADRDRVAVEVKDRGPGIPEDQLRLVQEAFVRLESSRSRETGGTGLGITLARAAAQLHGGELELENRPGGGLVARMLLPCGGPNG
ncbi:MAG TPA: ATP-binding protein [Allosphingosinicella sp.]